MSKGKVHLYTGDGKGKTTASIGLAVRAAGAGLKVCIYQFIKSKPSSEFKALGKIGGVKFFQCGRGLVVGRKPSCKDIECASLALAKARRDSASGKYDLIILDEVNVASDIHLIKTKDIIDLIKTKSHSLELVLTGRGADRRLVKYADYVTRFVKVRHPFDKGIPARVGIEY